LILCIENTFNTQIYKKMRNQCDIHSFINSYFICQHIYPCVKRVFNAWYLCVKCMNLWMNDLHTTFIINSSHANLESRFQMLCIFNNHLQILENSNAMANCKEEQKIVKWRWRFQHKAKKFRRQMGEKGSCVNTIS
jgi:hypothetical protein